MLKNRNIPRVIFFILLIIQCSDLVYAQSQSDSTNLLSSESAIRTHKDTIYSIDESFESQAKMRAKDSLFSDLKNKKIHLYGEAQLEYQAIKLEASYILVDLDKNEIYASYTYDKDSLRIGEPKFTDGEQEILAGKLTYNLDSKKGYIKELRLKQEENHLFMETAKKQADETIHFKNGRFTACDLEEPHYHFHLSKAIMIPEKRIVSGPMNLWIMGVPTPLGLPFMVIPQKKPSERTHGLLFPQFIPSSNYGMGIQNLGYYIPINDSIHTQFRVNLFTKGSWGLGNKTDYSIRYKFKGTFDVMFQEFRTGFPDNQLPTYRPSNKLQIVWRHQQDPKSNPYWRFNSNVNFISDNQSKNDLNPINANYFNNSFNSDINLQRVFPNSPLTMGLKGSIQQSSQSRNFVVNAPTLTANVSRFFPLMYLVNNTTGKKSAFESIASKIGVTYNMQAQNSASFADSLLTMKRFDQIQRKFRNGISQDASATATFAVLKDIIRLTPSITYANKINFQQTNKTYSPTLNNTVTDTLQKVGMSQNFTANIQATTQLYSYYKFAGKKQGLLRHIATPSVGYRFIPNLNNTISDSVGVNKALVTYSPFERSMFAQTSTQTASLLTFSLNNTFELKRKSDKDTLTGFKKTRIIDGLTFSGNYDFLKDSLKLSDLNISLRINPYDFLNFVVDGRLSFYDWDSTGRSINQFALKNGKGLGRMMYTNFNTVLVLAPKATRQKVQNNQQVMNNTWNADYLMYQMYPTSFIDFDIPWKMTLTHTYSIQANTNKSTLNPLLSKDYTHIQTIFLNGDISFTKRWKAVVDMNFDLQDFKLTNTRLTVTRNLHCWNLSAFWSPIGLYKSFMITLNANANMFKDAKIRISKPPELL